MMPSTSETATVAIVMAFALALISFQVWQRLTYVNRPSERLPFVIDLWVTAVLISAAAYATGRLTHFHADAFFDRAFHGEESVGAILAVIAPIAVAAALAFRLIRKVSHVFSEEPDENVRAIDDEKHI